MVKLKMTSTEKRRVSTKKKHVVGDAAVGQQVAKMLVNDQGLPELFGEWLHYIQKRATAGFSMCRMMSNTQKNYVLRSTGRQTNSPNFFKRTIQMKKAGCTMLKRLLLLPDSLSCAKTRNPGSTPLPYLEKISCGRVELQTGRQRARNHHA
jgi:hypothetical protein